MLDNTSNRHNAFVATDVIFLFPSEGFFQTLLRGQAGYLLATDS
jgi:hypothetical protein